MLFLTDEIDPEHRANSHANKTRRRSHMSAANTPAAPSLAPPPSSMLAGAGTLTTSGGLLSVNSSERLRRLSSQERSLVPDWRRNSAAVDGGAASPPALSSSLQRHHSGQSGDATASSSNASPMRRRSSSSRGTASPQVVVLVPPVIDFKAFASTDDVEELQNHHADGAAASLSGRRDSGSIRRRNSVVGFATPINDGLVMRTPDGNLLVSDAPEPEDDGGSAAAFDVDEIPSSLFIFSGRNPVRIACLHIIQNWWFHQFILACIIINSIFLALDQPAVQNPQGLVTTQAVLEWAFTVIFFLEMVLKVIALGFVLHPFSYLRTPWNCLDCIIVLASIINLFATSGNVSALRVTRVLRPLRSVSRIKNLKLLIAGLFEALPAVANTLLLYGFVLVISAIALCQLWQSQQSNRCYLTGFDVNVSSAVVQYTNATYGPLVFPMLDLSDTNPCGSSVHLCGPRVAGGLVSTCDIHRDIYTKPNLNYDSFPAALLLVLKVTVFDNWHEDMNDATRFAGYIAVPIFIILTVIGGYVCVNLFLAVLTDGYADAARKMKIEEMHAMIDAGCQTTFTHIDRHDDDGIHALMQERLKLRRVGTGSPRMLSQRAFSMARSEGSPALRSGSNVSSSPTGTLRIGVVSPDTTHSSGGDFGEFGTKVDVVIAELAHIDDKDVEADVDDYGSETGSYASFRRLRSLGGSEEVDDRCAARKFIGRVVSHRVTEIFVLLVTLLNVVALAVDHYGIDDASNNALDTISFACTIFFAVEISFKLFAFGPHCLLNGFNALDFILVVVGIITIAVNGSGGSAFAAFRALRVFRVFRFLKSFESLQTVIDSILQSVVSIGYLSILILIFLYIYAILGMQVFGTAYNPSAAVAPDSFGTIWESAILAFIVVTGDNWTDKMQLAMANYQGVGLLIPTLYFVTLNLIGNFILINLSVAIIVDKLQEKMDAHDAKANAEIHPPTLLLPPYNISIMARKQQQEAEEAARLAAAEESEASLSGTIGARHASRQSFRRSMRVPKLVDIMAPATTDDLAKANRDLDKFISGADAEAATASPNAESASSTTLPASPGNTQPTASPEVGADDEEQEATKQSRLFDVRFAKYSDQIEANENSLRFRLNLVFKFFKTYFISVPPVVEPNEASFFILSPTNPIRVACLWLVGLPAFHVAILLAIVTNVVFLCLDSPKASQDVQRAISDSDYFFASLFVFEAILKLIAYGAVFPTAKSLEELQGVKAEDRPAEAYFRDPWNCVDFFVTIVSLVGIFVSWIRPLRAIRTIRLVARIETTRIILVALMQAIPHVLHGLFLSGIVFLVFGILGVQLFKGLYYTCNDTTMPDHASCVGNYSATVQGPLGMINVTTAREWQRRYYNFDDLGASLLSLFVVSVGDNWSLIMYDGMSVTDDSRGLQARASPWMALFFIAMYIAGNFFSINMMVGILINYFKRKKTEQDGSAFLTAKQRQYLKAREVMAEVVSMEDEVKLLNDSFSPFVHTLITYKHPKLQQMSIFEAVLLLVILLNTACVASESDNMDATTADVLNGIELGCLVVFTIEMIIKWLAYGHHYFTNNWNRFDCIIVALGWIAVGLPQVTFLGFLRVFRVVKLIRGTGVERLVLKLGQSVQSLLHVVTILILTYFVFAVAGVELFGTIALTNSLNDLNNFQTVWNAMLVLYYCGTTDNWDVVMNDLSVQPPLCDPAAGNCGNNTVAVFYMLFFIICCTFIALQLFVAVIVEIFSDDDDVEDPIRQAFLELRLIWIACFGDKAHSIHYLDLVQYAPVFPAVLTGFTVGEEITRADMIRFLASLSLPVDSRHFVKYRDLVNALALKLYQVDPRTMGRVVNDVVGSLFIGASFSAAQVYALDVIADIWKEYQGTTKVGIKARSRSRGTEDADSNAGTSIVLEESDDHHHSVDTSPTARKKNAVQFHAVVAVAPEQQHRDDDAHSKDGGGSDSAPSSNAGSFVKSSSSAQLLAGDARPSTAGSPMILVEDMDD